MQQDLEGADGLLPLLPSLLGSSTPLTNYLSMAEDLQIGLWKPLVVARYV